MPTQVLVRLSKRLLAQTPAKTASVLRRTPSSCMLFPACWIAGRPFHQPILEPYTECAWENLACRMAYSLGVRSFWYFGPLYSVTPPRGRSPEGSHLAPQCWVAEGLRAGRPTTRGNRRTPLAPAWDLGRIAQAANDAPAGETVSPAMHWEPLPKTTAELSCD